ncbi:MAG: 2-dehydropantoate 2-reductase [Candidatus Omnitrophica bacterium]|nr:2-dehydropantoate 2-reductase [Candidatus Omnitrophota bacterium]
MRVLVYGAGGLGSVFGGFLARNGHDVTLLGREWHLSVVRREGLVIDGIWGQYRIRACETATDPSQVRTDRPYDLVLLTVKSYDTTAAAAALKPFVGPETTVLSLQNGLGNMEAMLASGLSAENLLIGRVIFGVRTEPGVATVTVSADPVAIGSVPGAVPRLSAFKMASLLTSCKIEAVSVEDIRPVIWSKVVYNCALNPLGALYALPYGRIPMEPSTCSAMQAVVRECYAVASAEGVRLEPADAEAYLRHLTQALIPKTGGHYPSMLEDLRRGRKLEIDALNGAIVRLGARHGIATPANAALVEELQRRRPVSA